MLVRVRGIAYGLLRTVACDFMECRGVESRKFGHCNYRSSHVAPGWVMGRSTATIDSISLRHGHVQGGFPTVVTLRVVATIVSRSTAKVTWSHRRGLELAEGAGGRAGSQIKRLR
jgi:hypothetical protein